MKQTLGSKIRQERLKADIKLRQFARDLGTTPGHLSDIEKDRRRPSEELFEKIANLLKIDFSELKILDARLGSEVREWIDKTPEVGQLLRKIREHPDSEKMLKTLGEIANKDKSRRKQ